MKRRLTEKTEKRWRMRFPFYDFTGIENHLQKMAAQGWLLKERGNHSWVFVRIPPQNLTFAVSYLPDLSDYDPQPTDGQQLYYELCESAGWVLVAQWNKMQIFCTANPDPVPLETDPASRLETIEKTMNRTIWPNLLSIFLLICVQFWSFFSQLGNNPAQALSNPVTVMIPVVFTLMLLIHILEALPYFIWRCRSRKSVAAGGDILPSRRRFQILTNVLLALAVLCLVPMLRGGQLSIGGLIGTMIVIAVPILFVTWIALSVKEYLKDQKTPRRKNQVITISTAVIGTAAAIVFILYATIMMIVTGNMSLNRDGVETIEIPIGTNSVYMWDIHRDTLPLYAEDLDPVSYPYYSYENDRQQTILASYQDIRQDAPPHRYAADIDVPQMQYDILTTRFPWVYEYCLNHALNDQFITEFERVEWRKTDSAVWNCSQAWQRYSMGEPSSRWLLSNPGSGTLIDITFYWTPTPEQIRIAGQKLFP